MGETQERALFDRPSDQTTDLGAEVRGEVHAVAAIPDDVPDPTFRTTEMGEQVKGGSELASPYVGQFDIDEIREKLTDRGLHAGC